MAIKTQGTELNRTVVNAIEPADFGAFNIATQSVVLKGDSARRLFITGFVFAFQVGAAADTDPNTLQKVFLLENITASADSNISPLPDANGSLRFFYGKSSPDFLNQLEKTFDTPVKLMDSVTYSLVGQIQTAGAAMTQTTVSWLTVFGFEENEYSQIKTIYSSPR